jgi:hypothetical protein
VAEKKLKQQIIPPIPFGFLAEQKLVKENYMIVKLHAYPTDKSSPVYELTAYSLNVGLVKSLSYGNMTFREF